VSEPREIQAVLGRAKPAKGVASRSFAQPRRLGPERARELARKLESLLPQLEKKLGEGTGSSFELALDRLGEVDAETLFAAAAEPLCVLRYRWQKDLAWLVWAPAEAVAVVESIFGARGAKGTARALSPAETKVATQLLVEVVRSVASAFQAAVADFALVQVVSELGSWRDGEHADPHRLELRLALKRGELATTLALYLPGIDVGDAARAQALPEKLPAHLEQVEVELSARLPGCEISLDQLLALEEGDVIPLDARLGDSTVLCVEGLTLGQARLGSHRGRLAVRIERLSVQPEAA